jgi:small conductance mechanosensitive channel
MPFFRTALLTLVFLGAFSLTAAAAPPPAAPNPPRPFSLTPIAAQFQTLITGTTTGTASAPTITGNAVPVTTTGANVSTPAAATTTGNETVEEINIEPGETFGTRALSLVLSFTDLLTEQSAAFADNFADLPQASDWLNRQLNEPHLQDRWRAAGEDLLLMVGLAFAGAFVLELLLAPARRHFRNRNPADLVRRVTAIGGLLVLELLPVILFVVVSTTLLNVYETQRLPRFVVENVIYAITLSRLVIVVGQILLAPRAPNLRLIPLTQAQANYLYRWLGFFNFIAVYGYFCVDLARSLRVPPPAVNAFGSLLALVLVIMTIIVIAQKRSYVAVLLRGDLSVAQRDLTPTQSLRLWFARSWHILAIGYLVIGYMVTALGVTGGAAILMHGTVLTFLVFVATGLAIYATGRIGAGRGEDQVKPQLHHAILRFFLRCLIWILTVAGLAAAWGANIPAFLATPIGQRISGSLFSIGVTVVVLALIYGFVSTSIERHLSRKDKDGRPIQASARVRTLLPMVRNAIFIIFAVVAGIVILSEAGVNIGPLLAGAGVIGVAVGFGSQTLVKDFLTGLFIVIENAIAIGDVVKIGSHSGTVESMTIRTIRLRDADGAVHVVPFSEANQIVNMTKDFAYALITVGVAYNSDLRKVMDVIKAVGEEIRQDPKFRVSILDPIEVLGIDSFAASAIMLQARIRTRPGRQWDVKRALLLRLKERFDQEKIEIPFPTVTQIQKT